jgi:hypothetical protein
MDRGSRKRKPSTGLKGKIMDKKIAPRSRVEALQTIFANHKGVDAQTQSARLGEALQEVGSVTTIEARRYLDILAPAARIHDLRHRQGWSIATIWERSETDAGIKHSIGRYVLQATPDLQGAT